MTGSVPQQLNFITKSRYRNASRPWYTFIWLQILGKSINIMGQINLFTSYLGGGIFKSRLSYYVCVAKL